MVYEVKCDNCGQLLDFGGKDPEENEFAPHSKVPEDAVKFDDKVYCKGCVKKFVEAGIGDVEDRIKYLEDKMDDFEEEMNLQL
jgi:hypothetical protein